MNPIRIRPWLVAILVACMFGAAARPAAADDDPPSRVARLSFLRGSVSFQPAGEQEWVEAVANRPLTSGDSLWVDSGGRAELHVGSTAIRLAERTSLTILDLSDHTLQLSLSQGSIIVSLRHLDDDDLFETDTPNLAFSLLRPGEYRLDVSDDGGSTAASVWKGQGQATGGGRTYSVIAGQQARFTGTEELGYEISPVPPADGFGGWSSERDRREDQADTSNYVSRELTGYEDLDDSGRWRYVASYGMVWEPVGVPAGWAPYRFGRWVWIEPWGWTWVDEQPWGFAPFHYGRWAFAGTGWVWIPGPVVVRPVYAPALVVFVGGSPGVGWFPLGPGEVFVPAYRVSPVYVRNVNVTNTHVDVERVNNVYRHYTTQSPAGATRLTYVNQQVPGAVTAVSRETFVNARPVARNTVEFSREEVARAPVSHMASLAPERGSLAAGRPVPAAAQPPAAARGRRVVSNRMPPPPPPSFSQREPALHVNPGQPAPRSEAAPVSRGPGAAAEPLSPPAARGEPAPVARGGAAGQAAAPAPANAAPVARPAPIERVGTPEAQTNPPPARTPEPHPNVQIAPPVRQQTQQESQEEQRKFDQWQQQRQQQQPKSTAQPGTKPQEKPQEKEKQPKDKPTTGRPPQ